MYIYIYIYIYIYNLLKGKKCYFGFCKKTSFEKRFRNRKKLFNYKNYKIDIELSKQFSEIKKRNEPKKIVII